MDNLRILSINVDDIIYFTLYLISFFLSLFVIFNTNFEKLFKQGSITAIKIGQILLALICAYLISQGLFLLYTSLKI